MSEVIITSEITESNPYRGTNSNPVLYKLKVTSEGTYQDMEYIRDALLDISNTQESINE